MTRILYIILLSSVLTLGLSSLSIGKNGGSSGRSGSSSGHGNRHIVSEHSGHQRHGEVELERHGAGEIETHHSSQHD